jgi:hypothetical protein
MEDGSNNIKIHWELDLFYFMCMYYLLLKLN